MGAKDPHQMTTGEVAQQARRAGVKGVENMNKEQMLRAMDHGSSSSQPGKGGGKGDRAAPAGSKPKDWKNVPGNQS